MQPRVRSHTGGFVPFVPAPREAAKIAKAFDGQDISVAVFAWPRRHGKWVTSAMVIVWRFLTRQTEQVAVVANSERQVGDTAFRTIRETFEQTPVLKGLVGAGTGNVLQDRVDLTATGSVFETFSASITRLQPLHAYLRPHSADTLRRPASDPDPPRCKAGGQASFRSLAATDLMSLRVFEHGMCGPGFDVRHVSHPQSLGARHGEGQLHVSRADLLVRGDADSPAKAARAQRLPELSGQPITGISHHAAEARVGRG